MRPIQDDELTLVASIDTVSKLLDVPKSTLRYYDLNGIIQSRRRDDRDNAPRVYTRQDILTLFDFLQYRKLDISVKDIQALNALPIETRLDKVMALISENQKKIQNTLAANDELLRNLSIVQKYLQMQQFGYRITESLEIHHVKEFHMLEPDHARQWLHGPFTQGYTLVYDGKKPADAYEGLSNADDFESPIIWKPSGTACKYLECLTRTGYASPYENNIHEHMDYLQAHDLQAGKILCLYLLPIRDEETGDQYDIYHTWIELL